MRLVAAIHAAAVIAAASTCRAYAGDRVEEVEPDLPLHAAFVPHHEAHIAAVGHHHVDAARAQRLAAQLTVEMIRVACPGYDAVASADGNHVELLLLEQILEGSLDCMTAIDALTRIEHGDVDLAAVLHGVPDEAAAIEQHAAFLQAAQNAHWPRDLPLPPPPVGLRLDATGHVLVSMARIREAPTRGLVHVMRHATGGPDAGAIGELSLSISSITVPAARVLAQGLVALHDADRPVRAVRFDRTMHGQRERGAAKVLFKAVLRAGVQRIEILDAPAAVFGLEFALRDAQQPLQLAVRDVTFDKATMADAVVRILRLLHEQHGVRLQRVHLSSTEISAEQMASMAPVLLAVEEVHLRGCRLTDAAMARLANADRAEARMRRLDVGYNALAGHAAVHAISQLLMQFADVPLERFNLELNAFTAVDLRDLASVIVAQHAAVEAHNAAAMHEHDARHGLRNLIVSEWQNLGHTFRRLPDGALAPLQAAAAAAGLQLDVQ